jgi:peptidoglycan/LPS O-acetylase OafA/YrhL
MIDKSKIHSLDFLRGIAVLAVCFCHFALPISGGPTAPGLFNWLYNYGKFGVEIFFVISGFVIPYSLYRGSYVIDYYFKFLWKRIIRLHPPYLISLLLTLIISYASHKARHVSYNETPLTIIQSLFYYHIPSDNPVYWTLRVEAEYYIFIGLIYPLLIRYKNITLVIGFPLLIAVSEYTSLYNYVSFFKYLPIFMLGVVGFMMYLKLVDTRISAISVLTITAACFVTQELPGTICALLTLLFILFYRRKLSRSLEYPGKLSYSIYLIHFPIGIKMMNFLIRKVPANYDWALFIGVTILCFLLAIAFERIVERPCANLSAKVKYPKFKQSAKGLAVSKD